VGVNEIVTPFLVVPNISWDEFLLYYDQLECAEMSKDSKKKKKKEGRHAEYGYNPTTPQWQNKLAGQDLLGFSQAFMATASCDWSMAFSARSALGIRPAEGNTRSGLRLVRSVHIFV
jgi:hypothetical protein